MPYTEEQKAAVLEFVRQALNSDGELQVLRPVIKGKPLNRWETNEVGPQCYLILRTGPPDIHIENSIRAILGHDSFNFRK